MTNSNSTSICDDGVYYINILYFDNEWKRFINTTQKNISQ